MVEAVSNQVEWHFNAPSPRIGSTGRDMLNRRIREVGLRSGLPIELADGYMTTHLGREEQGTGTDCACSSHLGPRMDR